MQAILVEDWWKEAILMNPSPVQAVCFSCGASKDGPLVACRRCHTKPISKRDRITSFCLSLRCLKPHHLERGAAYIKTRGRLPRFHPKVIALATKQVEALPPPRAEKSSETGQEYSTSFEFSESFFDFQGQIGQRESISVTVHIIGKPPGDAGPAATASQLGRRGSTYHRDTWQVGDEVSEEEYEMHRHTDDCLYVWYRWMGNGWAAKFVSKAEFDRLKEMEG